MSNNQVFSIYRQSNEMVAEPVLYRIHLSRDEEVTTDNGTVDAKTSDTEGETAEQTAP